MSSKDEKRLQIKNKKRIVFLILFGLVALAISVLTVSLLGQTYTYEYTDPGLKTTDAVVELENSSDVSPDLEVAEIIEQKTVDDTLFVTLRGKNRGRVYLSVTVGEQMGADSDIFYVHTGNIITRNTFFGSANGDIVFPIAISVFLIVSTALLTVSYCEQVRFNRYQYKNITRLGLIIFLIFASLFSIRNIFSSGGLDNIIRASVNTFALFSIVVLPVVFVLSILVMVTSIILAKKEGLSWRNFLGIILGVFLMVATILPDTINNILQHSAFIDIHNSQAVVTYVFEFLESAIFISLAYVEIIFIATVIVTIRSALFVPPLNRDYIIILGCYVMPDGTPGGLLKSRLERALKFARQTESEIGRFPILVCSGGKGEDEPISEAEAMKNYLVESGVHSKDILVEKRSKTTEENLKFSTKIIQSHTKSVQAKVAFATSGYHVFRAGYLANQLGMNNYLGMGAKTKFYFWINAAIREFVAELVLEAKRHFLTLLLLWLLSIFAFAMIYISEIA